MEIITVEGLAANLRLYHCEVSDIYVAVKVERKIDENLKASEMAFVVTAIPANAAGELIGAPMDAFPMTVALSDVDAPSFTADGSLEDTATKGALMICDGTLYEGDGTNWQERGPAPVGCTEAQAEMLAEWDRRARMEVTKAVRAWKRRSGESDILSLIGGTI